MTTQNELNFTITAGVVLMNAERTRLEALMAEKKRCVQNSLEMGSFGDATRYSNELLAASARYEGLMIGLKHMVQVSQDAGVNLPEFINVDALK